MKHLSAKFVREVIEPGKYHDGDAGLFLWVKPSGRKSYVQRLTIHSRRRDIGLGSTRWTTLTEARAAAQANRKMARTGGDPLAAKRQTVPTFTEAAERVVELHAETWRDGGKTANQWRASLRDYVMPRFGRRRVDEITTADVLAVLTHRGFWNTKRETARRVRQRIGAIMKWAIAEGHRDDNPAGDALGAALPRNGSRSKHHAALPHAEVAAAIAKVRASGAYRAAVLAFEFLVLTAARSGEVRGARWDEIDLEAETWTVPGGRMKGGRPHRVPLTARALDVLAEARELGAAGGLVFPSIRGRKLSDDTVSKLLRENGIKAVPHGFRSSFRQWAAERTNIPREVCEEALAHVNRDKIEAAYQRSDLFDRRRGLMDTWARYLDVESATVVAMGAAS